MVVSHLQQVHRREQGVPGVARGPQASFRLLPSSLVAWHCCARLQCTDLQPAAYTKPWAGSGECKAWHEGCILTKELQCQQESRELQIKLR